MKPVEGWNAKKNEDSYLVIQCPQFERNSYCFGNFRNADEYIEYLQRVIKYRNRDIKRLKNLLGDAVWESTHYGE